MLLPFNSYGEQRSGSCDAITWEQELNKINWLVLKSSSLNVINGLYLNNYQVKDLLRLARQVESAQPSFSFPKECAWSELTEINMTYSNLLLYLKHNKPIPKELREQVNETRMAQSKLVKKTIISSQKPGYMANNCLQCHAMPHEFSREDMTMYEANPISEEERKNIDRVHIEGIFGLQGVKMLWTLKSEVNKILTNSQKYILRDFRCCLLPPDDPANAANIGQVFVTNRWNNYLMEIRSLTKDQWKDFRPLYLVPISDYIEATLPAIRQKDKKAMLDNISAVIEESRKLDMVDYELQKDSLCANLTNQLSVDHLTGGNERQDEERQFIAAMFLLFPGNSEIYEQVLRNGDKTQLGYGLEK